MTAQPTDVVTVIMTAPDAETAERLGRTLVSERLAACASVVPKIVSMCTGGMASCSGTTRRW
jgi:uncharacterized protein involved in tolerance to divalent cations